jgi:hypothetical protein
MNESEKSRKQAAQPEFIRDGGTSMLSTGVIYTVFGDFWALEAMCGRTRVPGFRKHCVYAVGVRAQLGTPPATEGRRDGRRSGEGRPGDEGGDRTGLGS